MTETENLQTGTTTVPQTNVLTNGTTGVVSSPAQTAADATAASPVTAKQSLASLQAELHIANNELDVVVYNNLHPRFAETGNKSLVTAQVERMQRILAAINEYAQ